MGAWADKTYTALRMAHRASQSLTKSSESIPSYASVYLDCRLSHVGECF